MKKDFCDCCEKEIEQESCWQIGLKFTSWWNLQGDTKHVSLCGKCGSRAARLLGLCYDTGKILSIARKEQIDSVSVYGPNGGGFADVALGGVAGANKPRWHAEAPEKPIMGAMEER